MYLNEPNLMDIVKKQFRFKLNANGASFFTFVLLQVGVIVLAVIGNSHNFFYSSDESVVSIVMLSNDNNMGIASLWAFILGIMLTTRTKQSESFSFVSSRLSNHLSNLLFMLFASSFAGISVALSSSAIKFFGFLVHGQMVVHSPSLIESPYDFIVRIITAIAYLLLFFIIGYSISSLIQANKLVIVLFVLIWILFTSTTEFWNGEEYLLAIILFFGSEHSLFLFALKISGTIIGLFTISAVLTNRLEVRN